MKEKIDLIFSDLKNEVITEKHAHQQVLDLFAVINWVACSEKLPDNDNNVIVRDKLGQFDIGSYRNTKWYTETPMCNNGITHWMLLKPPCL